MGGEWQEQKAVRGEPIGEEEGLTGIGGAAWEPRSSSPEDIFKEACNWLREAGRKGSDPALRRMKRMGLSTSLLNRDIDSGF